MYCIRKVCIHSGKYLYGFKLEMALLQMTDGSIYLLNWVLDMYVVTFKQMHCVQF